MSTLRSRSFAQIVDLVSEGEIVGLVDGAKSIYFNETVLENPDGSRNFANVTYDTRPGTQAQTYIADTTDVQAVTNVATELTAASALTRSITNADANAVRVIMSVQALYEAKNDGSQVGTSVEIVIEVQPSGGSYAEKVRDTIDGKATSKYQRAYRIALTGSAPWNIRVSRTTADSTSLTLQNKTYWDSFTTIIDAKLRYPNSALVAVRLDAASFNGVPSRGYDVKLRKVQIPANYNPLTRVYTGSWNGTFTTEWTDNPAWCFYDLVTNTRYGLGSYIAAAQVDKWGLYTIGQYCDTLVDNGFGGTEPRFTCNLYLQSRQEAFKVVQDLASCFRSMVYWASGALTVAQDAPSDPVALFTQANVIDGRFQYSGASAKARHTVALVTWNDPADLYRQKIEYVEDAAAIARFGVIQTEVVAVGCTSRGQANRVGRWLLHSERHESETVTFSTGIEGALARPGQVIKVADSARAGTRLGGRVSSATTTVINVDSAVSLGAGTWTMYVMLQNGTVGTGTVSSAVGQVVTLTSALASAPQAGAQWILSSTSTEAQTFRVVTVIEQDGVIEITALKHDPDKFTAVETGLVLQPRDITLLDVVPAATNSGTLTEYLYTTITDVKVGVTLGWAPVDFAAHYLVQYRVDAANIVEQVVKGTSLEVLDAPIGNWAITVYAVSAIDKQSLPFTFNATVLGKTANPADVTGLQLIAQGTSGLLKWVEHPDLDVKVGGKISVRFSDTPGAQWNTASPIADFPGSSTSGSVPIVAGTYLARAVDSSGHLSLNAASIASTTVSVLQYNAVLASQQNPGFAGQKVDMHVTSGVLYLDQVVSAALDPDPVVASGQYQFLWDSGSGTFDYIDIGAIFTSRVLITFTADSENLANLVDSWPVIDIIGEVDLGSISADYVDTWASWDARANFDSFAVLGDASVAFEVKTTSDAPSGSATWTDWRAFYVGDYTARAFQFRMIVSRGSDQHTQVGVSALTVTIDVPDRIESAKDVAVASGGSSVVFGNQFFDVPAIAVTGQNLATGDYVALTGKTSAGFTMQFKNAAGTGVARTADWIAKGFGYKA